MQRGKLWLTLLVSSLMLLGSTSPSQAEPSPTHTQLYFCGITSTLMCIDHVDLSVDQGATWNSVPYLATDRYSMFNLAGTGFNSSEPGANVLMVDANYIEVEASSTQIKTNNIQIWAYVDSVSGHIDGALNAVAIDPNALFRYVVRSGSLSIDYTVGQGGSIAADLIQGAEFNVLTVVGAFRTVARFAHSSNMENYWLKCNSSEHLAADSANSYFQSMSIDLLGADNIFNGGTVSYTGSCGYLLTLEFANGSDYPTLVIGGTGPHFMPNGITLNEGHFEVLLPQAVLNAHLGLTTEAALAGGLTAQAKYVTGVEAVTYTVKAEANGAVRLIADGMHFSSPKLLVKRSGKAPKSIKVSGKAATVTPGIKFSKTQIADLIGASHPAKSKLSLTVSKSSKKAKNCKIIGGKLKTLKPGACVVTLKMQAKKAKGARKAPAPVYTTSTITVS